MKNTVVDRLLAASKDVWEAYLQHPFVCGIADGSLPREKFAFYMIQDYLYLYDYAKVFAYGVIKASDAQTMRAFATYVDQILNGEMDIHKGYMARLGIAQSAVENARPALKNQAYTAYMRTVAAEEGPAEILAAVLSCALSYEHIAHWIMANYPKAAEHDFYGAWVRGYASAEFAEGNRMLAEHIEQLSAAYTQAQKQHLADIFVACSRHEGQFWDMAWHMEM